MQQDISAPIIEQEVPERAARQALLPLCVVALIQASLIGWLASAGQLAPTRASLAVALVIVVVGLIPAFARPTPTSALASGIALTIAALVFVPLDPILFDWERVRLSQHSIAGGVILRLFNLSLFGPLLLHFASHFPRVRPLPGRALGLGYTASGAVLGILLAPVPANLRQLILIGLLGTIAVPLLIWAIAWLIQAAWHDQSQASVQARIVLVFGLCAELPLLLRPLIAFTSGQILPYETLLVAQCLLPVGVAYATLRYDLFGIDALVRRALAYTLLSTTWLALYFGGTAAITRILIGLLPQVQGIAAAVALLGAAALFAPLRRVMQWLIDQALFPERARFRVAAEQAFLQLNQIIDQHALQELLVEKLPEQIQASWADLNLHPNELRSEPDRVGWRGELVLGDQLLGIYTLGPRHSGLPYQREEQAQLNQLVRQAALALGYTTTIAELQGLNTELEQRVALRATQLLGQQRALAALAERQRLARDLHDSVTQALFSMHLSARAIRRMVGRDPQAAEQALTEQEDAARQALAEMRNLLAQLRAEPEPSSTAMRDLAADIAAHCASLAQRGELEVTIHVPTTLFLPTLQAEGLFQITREALHNVSKHSGVKTATCMLQVSEGCVLLNIRDHGQGFVLGQHAIGRYGLQGMHERAAELGAILRIDAQPGAGVCIEVQLAAVPTNLAA